MYLKKHKDAFTMIELVFVIVVIGILSAIAIPKFAATRDDAIITKGSENIASARGALMTMRQKNILAGKFEDINKTAIGTNFSNLLDYSVKSCNTAGCGGWATGGSETNPTYTFYGPTGTVVFTLQNNKLNCTSGPCGEYENQ